METPKEVVAALEKLDSLEKDVVEKYIASLQAELKKVKGEEDYAAAEPKQKDDAKMKQDDGDNDEPEFPPLYDASTAEDFEKAGDYKQQAADFQAAGDWEAALTKYNEAVLAAPPSALLYANRANALLKLGRPRAAERDCDLALAENPDSAKALRMRGKARKDLGKYELALKDLSASQTIDFDEGTVQDLKFLADKHLEMEKATALERVKEEEKLRKRAGGIKKAQEEAKREAAKASSRGGGGGMGGMGGMPGMPGGGGMADMMNDPELIAAMQNPKVAAALQDLMSGPGGPMGLMSNPAKLQELMSDPDVGPVLSKLMSKFSGGGMGGGGMPGMGGFPGASRGGAGAAAGDDDDMDMMPDLEEMD